MINIIDLSECPLSSRAGTYRLAPVYDNGASFATKLGDERIQRILDNEERITQSIMTSTTICSNCRKEFYIKSMEYRINELLVPAYNRYAEKEMEMSLRC